MSITITCDYCGEAIDSLGDQTVTITARGDKGGPKRARWKDGYLGHYHGEPCYRHVLEAIIEIHQDELERIPTATPDQIAALKPGDEGDHERDFEPLFDIKLHELPNGGILEIPSTRCDLAKQGLYFPSEHAVKARGINTLGDLRRAIDDGLLLGVHLIGPKRLGDIKQAVARIYGAAAAPEDPAAFLARRADSLRDEAAGGEV
jgi:hypothetical protein